MSLGMWPSSLLLIWLTFTTSFMFYVPFQLAKIPQESLAQLPVLNTAAHCSGFVYYLLPYFARSNNASQSSAPGSILSATTLHGDAVPRPIFDRSFDGPIAVEPAIAAEIDPGAHATAKGSTHSTFASSVPPSVVSRISASLHDIYHSVTNTFVFPGKGRRQRLAPSCTCDLLSSSHPSSSQHVQSDGTGRRTHTGRLSNITASLHAFWKRGQRLLGRHNIEGSPLPAEQSLTKQDPSCNCAALKSADAMTDQPRLDQKGSPSVQSTGIRSAAVEFVDNSELPRRPITRIHDCDIDDPNWQFSFTIGRVQYRHCRPTYLEWRPQDYLVPNLRIDRRDPNERIDYSLGSWSISKPASRSNPSKAIGEEEGLVYGLPRCELLVSEA